MMNKLTAQNDERNKQFKPKIFQSKRRGQTTNFISVIMTKETIRTGMGQTAEIEEFHLVVEYSVDKHIEIDQGMNRIIEMTLGKEALEVVRE